MITIDRFTDRLGSTRIPLPDRPGGGDAGWVTATALTAHQDRAIRSACPPPLPPLKKDPNGGSLSRVPDEQDPAYRAADDAWWASQTVMRLAVSMGFALAAEGREPVGFDPDAPAEQRRAWLTAAEDSLTRAVSRDWLQQATAALAGLSFAAALAEAGEGNSGPPPKADPATAGDRPEPATT